MPPTPRTALGSLLAISFVVAGCADAPPDSSPTTQSETTITASTTTTVTETTREVDDDPRLPPVRRYPPIRRMVRGSIALRNGYRTTSSPWCGATRHRDRLSMAPLRPTA